MAAKVLLATTCRWFSTARIALAFGRAGAQVEVVCPGGHCAVSARVVQKSYAYNGVSPIRSLERALLSSQPDIVVPCDDLAMKHLHRVYELSTQEQGEAARRLRDLLTLSLGDPAGYAITESRDDFMATLYTEGIDAPETKSISSVEEIEQWLARFGFPAVLKADGTSGGEGVKVVHTLPEAVRTFRILSSPLAGVVAAKRVVMDRDWNCIQPWLEQRKRVVSIQSFVNGPDANMAVACWQGEILSSISVEVLQTWKPKGPATLVRIIDNPQMYKAAEKILRRLKFSGLCGLDFLIDRSTGNALLIEMNARATQTCPLPLGPGRDLIAAICSVASGKKLEAGAPLELHTDTIALFPLAWQGDIQSKLFQAAHHDIPWEKPELVQMGMQQIKDRPRDKWARAIAKIGQQWS